MEIICKSINPYTQKTVTECSYVTKEDISKKLLLAKESYNSWKQTSIDDRLALFKSLVHQMMSKTDELALIITQEMGKVIRESKIEIHKCITQCNYIIENIKDIIKTNEIITQDERIIYKYEPMGTIFGVMPFNYPFWQVFRYAIPAIAIGNNTILKQASTICGCSLRIEKLFLDAGFPAGILQSIIIRDEDVESIIASPIIVSLSFTGSPLVGKILGSLAGKYGKKSILELGGNDPLIVCEDANIEEAAQVAFQSRMNVSGQVCISPKRYLIHRSIFTSFVDLCIKKIKQISCGDPLNQDTGIGPIATLRYSETLKSQYENLIKTGGKIVVPSSFEQCIIEPALFVWDRPSRFLQDKEIFGPFISCIPFSTIEEAIAIANDTPFGLSASVWGKDIDIISKTVAPYLECGSVFINRMVVSNPFFPIGGKKDSGFGKELGKEGCLDYAHLKIIVLPK